MGGTARPRVLAGGPRWGAAATAPEQRPGSRAGWEGTHAAAPGDVERRRGDWAAGVRGLNRGKRPGLSSCPTCGSTVTST